MSGLRWLFHVASAGEVAGLGGSAEYAPAGLAAEGFIHASYKDVVLESARLYFAGVPEEDLRVLAIDPRRLDARVEVAATPRGPMPHVHGAIPRDAITVLRPADVASRDDAVRGTRIALFAFEGMTLLDLVGPLDALSRIASMGFDPTTTCEVVGLTDGPWSGTGATLRVEKVRPALDAYDMIVVPGGMGTRALALDRAVADYLATFPPNRLTTSVCTGSLLLGAAGRLRGKRATTHTNSLGELAQHGAITTPERVVDEGQLVTSAGVTSGLALGVHMVRRLMGDEVAAKIARQMELDPR